MNRATPARNNLAYFSLSRASFFASARYSRARRRRARASAHISKANVGGAGKMVDPARKNPSTMGVERTFLCPSSSSCFDRSKSYREASKIANGRANSASPQKTRRRVLCKTTHSAMYVWVVSVPQVCRLVGGVCFFFLSLVFFSSQKF